MLSDLFKQLTQPLRDCFKSVDTLFAEWERATKPPQDFHAPYKIEPPAMTAASCGPREISVADAGAFLRNLDMTRPANPDALWQLYGYGAFRRAITLHLTHFSAETGGRASALKADTQEFLGYCGVHDLMDLLDRADREEITSLPNPNYAYISRAIDELMKMETWTGFNKEKLPSAQTAKPSAAIFEFRQK